MIKKISAVFIAILLIMSICVTSYAADINSQRIKFSMGELIVPDGEILGVSSKGEWGEYPENSIPAIIKAAQTEIDFVLLDVKRTSDGQLIVFSDDTTKRMISEENVLTISETKWADLKELKLKKACGGSNEETSEYTIPLLEDALKTAKENDIPVILRADALFIKGISDILLKYDLFSMCAVMTSSSVKETNNALVECEETPLIIGSKQGNVIFAVSSYVNGFSQMGAIGTELKTTNRYGINYYYSVLNNFGSKMRIIADPTNPETCGARTDTEKWWNDLINRGYNVIITDYADLFSEYKKEIRAARNRLQKLYDGYVEGHKLPDFKDDALNDFKKAYTDAIIKAESLLNDASSSLQDLNDCYTDLKNAINDININYSSLEDGSAGTTITLPRILLCIAFAAVAITVQIYFFKRRKKV